MRLRLKLKLKISSDCLKVVNKEMGCWGAIVGQRLLDRIGCFLQFKILIVYKAFVFLWVEYFNLYLLFYDQLYVLFYAFITINIKALKSQLIV